MSDRSGLPTIAPMDDIELITRYLNHQLDDEQVKVVGARLENDPEFYYLAEPLLFAWSVPRHVDRPRPPGELEELWDHFTRRASFAHQKRKKNRRRLWFLGILLLGLALPSFTYRSEIRRAYRDWRDFVAVPYDTGWITLRPGNQVRLGPGARLRAPRDVVTDMLLLKLQGTARFRVVPTDTAQLLADLDPLAVETRAGDAFTAMGEFTVTTRGDTTDVEVHRPSHRRYLGFLPLPGDVAVKTRADPEPMKLGETQAARLVRGRRSERTKR